jgi:hypothetical protein
MRIPASPYFRPLYQEQVPHHHVGLAALRSFRFENQILPALDDAGSGAVKASLIQFVMRSCAGVSG